MPTDLIVGIVGALGGGLIASVTSIATLRSTRRADREQWIADRTWEHATEVAHARRDAFSRYLACENAMIMSAGATASRTSSGSTTDHMPDDQMAVYEALQNAYATALLLASTATQSVILECQTWLDDLVWASWEGRYCEMPRDDLQTDLIAVMQRDAIEPPPLRRTSA